MKNYFSTLLLAAVLCAPFTVSAQVTIGSDRAPSQWSLLDLCTREQQRALHNARMDSIQRNALVTPASPVNHRDSAQGLMLFNTDTDCLEFWSGTRWVSLCEGDTPDPCEGFGRFDATWCAVDNPTIADLTAKARAAGGRGTVVWYNAATGGSRFTNPNTPLVNGTYWAANCADATARVPVVVTLEPNCDPLNSNAGRIATFVNVMYDFQHQQLTAFTNAGGNATSWQWQMRVGASGEWHDITLPGATSATWTIPSYFIYDYVGIPRGRNGIAPDDPYLLFNGERTNTVQIFFRCRLINSNPESPVIYTDYWHNIFMGNPLFNILFIRTNTSGFDIDENGVRSLRMGRAPQLAPLPLTTDSIRVALLNLGQSGTGAWRQGVRVDIGTPQDDRINLNNAGDLGDFYQWGRWADGHQHTVWRKPTTGIARPINFGSQAEGWGGTSIPVARGNTALAVDANGQIPSINTTHFGNFILTTANNTWSVNTFNGLAHNWGNGHALRNAPTSLTGEFGWSERGQNNNPCPPGWRIPTRWDWADLFTSDGSSTDDLRWGLGSAVYTPGTGSHSNNSWKGRRNYRSPVTNTASAWVFAYGGTVLLNPQGEAVFLPHVGRRSFGAGTMNGISEGGFTSGGMYGAYVFGNVNWATGAEIMWLTDHSLLQEGRIEIPMNNTQNAAIGHPIRCIK